MGRKISPTVGIMIHYRTGQQYLTTSSPFDYIAIEVTDMPMML
jgi:hypothetical protein